MFQAVQEREDYEELVKGIVDGNGDMMEQSSLNKLEESTGVDKDNDGWNQYNMMVHYLSTEDSGQSVSNKQYIHIF